MWNDYLLPTLVLDIKKYRTIPMLIQYFRGSYGRVEMGPMMACIMLAILPIIIRLSGVARSTSSRASWPGR